MPQDVDEKGHRPMKDNRRRWVRAGVSATAGVLTLAALTGAAGAQEAEAEEAALTAEAVQAVLDNIWVLIAAILVIFMQAGFALVEAGLTRAKSVANIMAKNMMDFCVGVVAFAAVGFAFAFGSGNDFIGTNGFFLGSDIADNYLANTYPNLTQPTFFIFQVAFAATAATIVSGAMAERTKFKSYLIYSFLITALVYPIVVHWTWGGGWLAQLETPYIDFAGSSIVHMVGGVAALIGAAFLGPRIGKYDKDGKPRAIPGHSIPFAIIGVLILWIGWFGFNPGSELAADLTVPAIAVVTLVAGAVGGVVSLFAVWLKDGKPDVAMAGNGVLAGLVGITAGTAHVNVWGAVAIGAICGILVVFAVAFFDRIRIDDPVGAVSVHGVCGLLGTVLVGVFATTQGSPLGESSVDGLLAGGGASQLVTQLIGVGAIAAFAAVAMLIIFGILKATIGLRVTEEEEIEGLDVHQHGFPGYAEDIVPSLAGSSSGVLVGT
jgi:Amt family ammonium transporter